MHRVFRVISTVISLNWRLYPSPDLWNPWGTRQYLYRPDSVKNVGAFRAAGDSSRLWYPFHASRTVLLVCEGIINTCLMGVGVWCVSLIVAWFGFCKSTILPGDPSFFGATTILEHQLVRVHTGAGSIMPTVTSLSSSSFTPFIQWWGVGISVWTAVSFAPGMNSMSNSLPSIDCRGWCGHMLNTLYLKYSNNHCWSMCLLL